MINENDAGFERFSHNIIWIRQYYGISKKKMAQLLEIGEESLNQIEKGVLPKRLSVQILFRIQEAFGICPADFLGQRFGE